MFMSRISSLLPPCSGAASEAGCSSWPRRRHNAVSDPEGRLLMNGERQTSQRFDERRGDVLVRTERIEGLDIAVLTIQPGGAARA
ncbi:hypothetical protein AB870_26460 (plasmid) [Pandoraea faecigallinarum]|uniref:Uncharacterized protein n=1 Tax=Pandoraea faecigallinarum TaxID=656179 RepID=A0A1D8X6E5_9BURK|nr:hypothetical protein [Pandoraea faecigallinarum]AOX47846.1 hypothetical protein AB870_26460 [Pandoraea faecigallinarum]